MSAADALKAAQAAGVDVRLDGEDLLLQAPAPPPAAVLEGLSHNKSEIIVLLRQSGNDRWRKEAGQTGDERAAIGLGRVTVETETRGIPWAEWQASRLNRLFQGQGLTGELGRITPETVGHGR